jgi:hypothetical protein
MNRLTGMRHGRRSAGARNDAIERRRRLANAVNPFRKIAFALLHQREIAKNNKNVSDAY